MIKRRKTRIVCVGPIRLGYGHDIVIQSMTKVPTVEVSRCVRQVNQLVGAGCGLVRVAVATRADSRAFAEIVQKVCVPLIADIHFSAARAIEAIEAGASKVRLNPGNIRSRADINRIIDAAKLQGAAVRIGVNEASIRDLKAEAVPARKRTALMLKEMKGYVRLFERRMFEELVLSAKSSDAVRTIEINRRVAEQFDYPIHLGLTHAGLPETAAIPSAVALGTFLAEGIGDTIRVSVAGNPLTEVKIAQQILGALCLCERRGVELIVCPSCARAQVDILKLAGRVEKALGEIDKPVRVAVMGCIVNGPGEAADADVAVCAAKNKGYIYRHGRRTAIVAEDKIISALLRELKKHQRAKQGAAGE